jgi:hypothetical protein
MKKKQKKSLFEEIEEHLKELLKEAEIDKAENLRDLQCKIITYEEFNKIEEEIEKKYKKSKKKAEFKMREHGVKSNQKKKGQ